MKRKADLEKIISLLSHLQLCVKNSNSISLTDINIIAEDFFRDLLNLIYDLNLKNINLIEGKNFPAIDLVDENKKIVYQVTSDSSKRKIKYTINKFIENKLFQKYKILFFMIIGDKKRYKSKFDTKGKFVFDESKHIKGIVDVINDVRSFRGEKITKILNFLETELEPKLYSAEGTVANEIETIMDLIEYLSDESNSVKLRKITSEPDPEKKIYKRFANHASFLKGEIQSYIPMYAHKRQEAENSIGLDSIRTGLIRTYLRYKSDAFLRASKNNPTEALDKLTDFFVENLSKNKKKYDNGAIRYYLIYQIIQCNVFPNN